MDLCSAVTWTNEIISFIACSCPSDSLWRVWTGQQMRGWKRELWYQVTDGSDGKVLPGDPPAPLPQEGRPLKLQPSTDHVLVIKSTVLFYCPNSLVLTVFSLIASFQVNVTLIIGQAPVCRVVIRLIPPGSGSCSYFSHCQSVSLTEMKPLKNNKAQFQSQVCLESQKHFHIPT